MSELELVKKQYAEFLDACEIEDYTDKVEALKKVTCRFFINGEYKKCTLCAQPAETVIECAGKYDEHQQKRPSLAWSKNLRTPKPRVKVKTQSLNIGLKCDSCYLNASCPSFEEDSECSIDWTPDMDIMNNESMIDYVIKIQSQRVNRANAIEQNDGGVPDVILSNEIDRLNNLINSKRNLNTSRFSMNIESSSGNATSGGGSILASIFGAALAGGGNKEIEATKSRPIEIQNAEIVEPIMEELPSQYLKGNSGE